MKVGETFTMNVEVTIPHPWWAFWRDDVKVIECRRFKVIDSIYWNGERNLLEEL